MTPGMRSPEPHRNAEPLGRADDDVGPVLPRRREQAQAQEVRGDHKTGPGGVHRLSHSSHLRWVPDQARRARGADERPEEPTVGQAGAHIADVEHDPHGGCARRQHSQCLWMGVGVHHEGHGTGAIHPVQQCHRLGGRGRLVEHRCVRDREAGQVGHHGLEVQQRLEAPLGDLRLVRRVGGVPAGRLEHVAPNHCRRDRVVVAQTDHRDADGVGRGHPPQGVGGLLLGERRRQVQALAPGDRRRDGGPGQRLEVRVSNRVQHELHVVRIRTDVAVDERGRQRHGDQHAPTIVAPGARRGTRPSRVGPEPAAGRHRSRALGSARLALAPTLGQLVIGGRRRNADCAQRAVQTACPPPRATPCRRRCRRLPGRRARGR